MPTITSKNFIPAFLEYKIGKLRLSMENGIHGFEYVSTINSEANTHKLLLSHSDYKELDIRELQKNNQIQFSFGYAGGTISDVHQHWLTDYSMNFLGLGINLEIVGCDQSLRMNRNTNSRSFSKMKISDMVRRIASDNKVEARVEETEGLYTILQIWLSDMQFIKQCLIPRAMSANGRADYDIYFDHTGILHFHTPEYSNHIFRRYIYGEDSHIHELKISFQGELTNALGGLSCKAFGYDPLEKKSLEFTATLDNTTEKELLGDRTFLTETKNTGRYFHQTQSENLNATKVEAKSQWYRAQRSRYHASMICRGDPLLEAGKVISLLISTSPGGCHALSGRYLVQEVRHLITASGYINKIFMVRNGVLDGEKNIPGIKRTNLVEDHEQVIVKESRNL
jgi:hypothetical protein